MVLLFSLANPKPSGTLDLVLYDDGARMHALTFGEGNNKRKEKYKR